MVDPQSRPEHEPLPAAPAAAAVSDATPRHRLGRWSVLSKYRKAIISAAALGLAAGAIQTLTTPRVYRATAVVRVDPEGQEAGGADAGFMQTEANVIRGRDLTRRVVRTLQLDRDPRLDTLLRPKGSGGASAMLWSAMVRTIRSATGSSTGSAAGHAASTDPAGPAVDPAETPAETRAIEMIAANLDVEPQPDIHVLRIEMSSGSPELSASVANAVSSEYARAAGLPPAIAIVERARAPRRASEPNAVRNILIALSAGLAIGLLIAFGLDRLDDTIKTPEDITQLLRLPFLGLIPAVRTARPPVLSGPVPHAFGEAYRSLRTSLVFTSGAETTRVVAVTSAQSLEGRTTTACNLALVLAFGGSRVLLVDADLRRPGVHKALAMPNEIGLWHLLVGQARVREAIQRTNDPNLCVVTAGRSAANPSDLFGADRMKQLLANLKQGPFDWVVIDAPPVLGAPDTVTLTPLVDAVTLVIGSEMTRRGATERAIQMLMAAQPKVIGAVLNRVDVGRYRQYYERFYGT